MRSFLLVLCGALVAVGAFVAAARDLARADRDCARAGE